MFIDDRAATRHPLFLWNIVFYYRLYAKYAISLLLSAICITTPDTDLYVSHCATGLRQVGRPWQMEALEALPPS